MHEFNHVWHGIVTPHQELRGELAAWPYGMSTLRLIRFLGATRCMNSVRSFHAWSTSRAAAAAGWHAYFLDIVLTTARCVPQS